MADRQYVTALKEWELPRLNDLEDKLLDDLVAKAPARYLNRERLGEELYGWFLDRLRELVQPAVNETIEYWLKGLADGNDGDSPQLCIEFPFLQRLENVEALTVAYCVDNQDGTRTEPSLRAIAASQPWQSRSSWSSAGFASTPLTLTML